MSIPPEELELLTQIAADADLAITYVADGSVSLHLNGSREALVAALIWDARFAAWVRTLAAEKPAVRAADLVERAKAFALRPFLIVNPTTERLLRREPSI